MRFPHTFYEDEVREGFYISGSIKRAWAAQLEVLEEIDKVCKKHNIRWFADCGTLLGAVRHGGYIPWDDDLDICMLREDYIRFNEVAERELPKSFYVLNMHKKEVFYQYLTRVTNGHRLNFDKDHLDKFHDCPYAVGIDIFPLDYISNDEEAERDRQEIAHTLYSVADSIPLDLKDDEMIYEIMSQLKGIYDIKPRGPKPIKQQVFEAIEKLYTMFPAEGAKYVGLMTYWAKDCSHKYPIEYFEKTIKLPFEGMMINAPAAYDGVLKIEYNDYGNIVKGGGVHNYPFFLAQEDFLKGLLDSYYFIYEYNKQDLEEIQRRPGKQSKEDMPNFVKLMKQAHNTFVGCLKNGDVNSCTMLLETCQNSAINIGTLIEKEFGMGYVTVGILEEYCELLYEISQIILGSVIQMETVEAVSGALSEILNKLEESTNKDIINKKEVVFFPFRSCYWYTMQHEWEKAVSDPDTDVYVVPIPYYDRSATGVATEMHYEIQGYPDNVKLISYEEYEVQVRCPDEIIIQSPYDECNYTTTVPARYYARNLKPYTKQLTYIPYFVMDDIDVNNQKGLFTMGYFCKVPGVVLADKIIVQSDIMRQRYIECLTDMAGDDTRSVWENKICANEISLPQIIRDGETYKKNELLEKLPETWKDKIYRENGSRKKIILCCVGVASYEQHGEDFIQKLRYIYNMIAENKEKIVLIFRPYLGLEQIIQDETEKLYRKLQEAIQEYKKADFIIYDENMDVKDLVSLSDAYYGELGMAARACNYAGKPTMVMDVDMGDVQYGGQ